MKKASSETKVLNFEQYKTCSYFLKLFYAIESTHYKFESIYDKLIKLLALKEKDLPKIPNAYSRKRDEKFRMQLEKYLTNFLANSVCKSGGELERKINYISSLYNLDEYEKEFFTYAVLRFINPVIAGLESISGDGSEFHRFGNILGLKTFFINALGTRMTDKGILVKHARYADRLTFDLSSAMIEVFEDPKIKTNLQIKRALLGERQKSELECRDFSHIKKDKDITLNILTNAVAQNTKGVNILLYGAVGTGKTQFAKLIANKAKVDMYAVTVETKQGEASRRERLSDLASKQAILSKIGNTCILFDEAEDVMNRGFSEFGNASKGYLNTLLEETPVPVFWTTNNIQEVDPAFLRRMTYAVEFKKLTEELRFKIWQKAVWKNDLKVDNEKLVELNQNYEISPSVITNAVKTTKLINGGQEDFETFVENLAQIVTKKKNVKKQKGFAMSEYDANLVNTDIDIHDLTTKIKNCGRLNFSLCLYGEPGTGKSLYARYLAKELGIEVILKRASDLLSMWVGGTEQNIADAFAEAKAKKAMLIFDEADTFLQNRNNAVRSWEVAQVNEMLTWMESHEYPFVCTTNLLDTLDEASLRRFTFKIRFDFMTKEQVSCAMEHFFDIKDAQVNIKGLTAGDFATVKKKADFLKIRDCEELIKMLQDEVKIKKSKILQNTIGFKS